MKCMKYETEKEELEQGKCRPKENLIPTCTRRVYPNTFSSCKIVKMPAGGCGERFYTKNGVPRACIKQGGTQAAAFACTYPSSSTQTPETKCPEGTWPPKVNNTCTKLLKYKLSCVMRKAPQVPGGCGSRYYMKAGTKI